MNNAPGSGVLGYGRETVRHLSHISAQLANRINRVVSTMRTGKKIVNEDTIFGRSKFQLCQRVLRASDLQLQVGRYQLLH